MGRNLIPLIGFECLVADRTQQGCLGRVRACSHCTESFECRALFSAFSTPYSLAEESAPTHDIAAALGKWLKVEALEGPEVEPVILNPPSSIGLAGLAEPRGAHRIK
jgi:hypothetical protein